MAWSIQDRNLDEALKQWAVDKDASARFQFLLGLFELTDRPWDELPGFPIPGRSPMWRWAKVGQTFVAFLVAEPQGRLLIMDIRDG